ncbi:MAG: preprotein translocase subunit SecY [Proteobacteria bacterium]|nr:preprotein translocase subunit SecY [Pseudomonadota bacterium]
MLGGIESIGKIPELRNRLLFTLGLLAVYRIGCAIPTPGIDSQALASFFAQAQNTIFGMFNLFSGGALERLSIFTLGIMPYISASIILQLLTVVIPYLDRLSKEGELGRKKITQYTRYGTVVLSLLQSAGTAVWLEGMKGPAGEPVVMHPGPAFIVMTMITMTSGTAFIMWLGEQITERGVGNGISLIIFAGIVARMPAGVARTFSLAHAGEISPFKIMAIVLIMVAVVAFIIFMERGQRRIPIQYAKRVVGRRVYGGQSTHLPLKVNTAGVIPPIFASSLLIFPSTIVSLANFPGSEAIRNILTPTHPVYNLLYVAGIIFFCYFYTAVQFNPIDVAENLKKYGGYIPGIRPGSKTAEYIDQVLTRITLGGSLYVAVVCVLPALMVSRFNVPFWYGGTSLMIVVGVGMDTIAQIESHMLSRHYEGFLGRQKIKGRRG